MNELRRATAAAPSVGKELARSRQLMREAREKAAREARAAARQAGHALHVAMFAVADELGGTFDTLRQQARRSDAAVPCRPC